MENEIVLSDEWQSLVDDCKAIHTEMIFNARWELIAGYHALGKRISEDLIWHASGNGEKLTCLSNSTGIGERDLYRAIQFYEKYPDLDKLPDGKNISWSKIVAALPGNSDSKPLGFVKLKSVLSSLWKLPVLDFWPEDKQRRFNTWREAGKEFLE
jgi:hypothetical protein